MTIKKEYIPKNLLLIVPHFQVFIKDQVKLIKPKFNDVSVLLPSPYFSSTITKLPFVNKYFRFLKYSLDSQSNLQDFNLITVKFLTLPFRQLQKRNYFFVSNRIVKFFSGRSFNFNLIHAHFLENGFAAAQLKHEYNVPFIITAHGGDVYSSPFKNSWNRRLAKYILREADQIITVSNFNAEKLVSLGCPKNKLHVIPNGYDEEMFKPCTQIVARTKLGLPLNKKILLAVGNLVNVKGHVYLISAMERILKKHDAILVIVGSGPLYENLKQRIYELKLSDKILLVGRVTHSDIPLFLNACDIFVLPSLSEGFPTVIPEAMACGKPVVGTNVGGIPEIITNQDVGLLVNPRDILSLADGIIFALEQKWDSEIILKHVRNYSWKNIVKQILSVYQEILQS